MLYRTFPPDERVQAIAYPDVRRRSSVRHSGRCLAGLLIEKLSWHWAFYVNVPVGISAFLFGLFFLREHREPAAGRFDMPGFLLAGDGFPLVMYALSEGPSRGWGTPGILDHRHQRTLRARRVRGVRTADRRADGAVAPPGQPALSHHHDGLRCAPSAGFSGVLFLVPLFLQEARGASPLASGLTTFPEALGVLCSSQLVARLYPRIGPRRLMAGGLIGVATAMSLLCTIRLDSNPWLVRL